jgi:hypothetical protein
MAKPRPSFLKRQKEQQRQAKAAAKREARFARKHARETTDPDALETGPEAQELDDFEPEASSEPSEPGV